MDSEHRHELQENDLAVAMANLKDWWAKHQMKVLGGAVLLAALILAVRWMSASASETRNTEQYQLAMSATPEAYRSLAQATSNDSVQVLANLRGADAILPQIRKPLGTGANQITEQNRKQLLDQADAMYKAALAGAEHPLVKIKALLGMAAIAETRGDWAKAKEHYQAAQKAGGEGYEFLTKRAARFEAALPRTQIEPVYGRAVETSTTNDLLKSPFLPGDLGKEKGKTDDEKGLLLPLVPDLTPGKDKSEDDKDDKEEKDAKTDPLPLLPDPLPAPDKDGK